MKKKIRWGRWLIALLLSPLCLFLLLAVLIYLPPVQRYVVRECTERISASTGMTVRIGHVKLAFPLDFVAEDLFVAAGRDTLLDARRLRADVALWPLFSGTVDVKGIGLWRTNLDTHSLIPDTRVAGRIGRLYLSARHIDLPAQTAGIDDARLEQADLHIHLSDTARSDTTPSAPINWTIRAEKALVSKSRIALTLPGDTLRIAAGMDRLELRSTYVDLGESLYRIRRILWEGDAAYDLTQAPRTEGLDYNHLSLSRIRLQMDTLRYGTAGLALGLAGMQFDERSGFSLKHLSARLTTDTVRLLLSEGLLRTPHTRIEASVNMDWNSLKTPGKGLTVASVAATVGPEDLLLLAGGLPRPQHRYLPDRPLTLALKATGNERKWSLETLRAEWPHVFSLRADGQAALLTDSLRRHGDIDFALRTGNLDFLRKWMDPALAKRLRIPAGMSLRGKAGLRGSEYRADMRLTAGTGHIRASGRFDQTRSSYRGKLDIRQFPLQAFLPKDSLFDLSARMAVSGRGFDVFSPATRIEGAASIDHLRYTAWNIDSIRAGIWLKQHKGHLQLESRNELLQALATIDAQFTRRAVQTTFHTAVEHLDLQKFTNGRDSIGLTLTLDGKAHTDKKLSDYGIEGAFSEICFCTQKKRNPAKDLLFGFTSAPDTLRAHIAAGDLSLNMAAGHSVEDLFSLTGRLTETIAQQIQQKYLDQPKLTQLLPRLSLRIKSGKDNPISNMLKFRGYTLNDFAFDARLDPVKGLNGDGHLYALNTGNILIDTVRLGMFQDSAGLHTSMDILNTTKYNPHLFKARIESFLLADGAGLVLRFKDRDGREGMRVGLRADVMTEGGIRLSVFPRNSIIAFRNFTINDSNYVYLRPDRPVKANIDLLADDGTALRVYSAPEDTIQDLTFSISKLNLKELTGLFPLMPTLSGFLESDIHLAENDGKLSAVAHTEVQGMKFEEVPLGDIGMDAVYFPKDEKGHYVNATLARNGTEIMTVDGVYAEDDGGTLTADLEMIRFPLSMLNGFMGEITGLAGYADGTFSLDGAAAQPLLNGTLRLDSAYFYSLPYGLDFRFEDRPLQITDSRLRFEDFSFYSKGKSPLKLRGDIDFSQLENIRLDLAMHTEDFELVNARRTDKSMVFGKVFADYRGTLRGTSNHLIVRGMLDIQDRTDVTYILKDTPLSVEDQLNDLVQFVDFGDTLQTTRERPVPMGLDVTLNINVGTAAHTRCELSEDGESYVDVEGGGELTLRFTPMGEMRLTGRYTVNSGEMKYALPVIPLKTFELVNGSYVEFTGDVANPTLNIAAKERIRASVTENEASRSVAFDVGISITKPLNQMGLEFTLEAPEDQTVQNQLSAMSREQRGKLAVSMLATGMYLIEGNSSSFKANNALNAFLQSEIQNIAGNALRTIDLTFNMEDGTTASGDTRTDYSFRFAKRFWGNRVSVIIGGKVSTGSDTQEQNESFIDNVSLEYRLDKSATRYVRLFYDHSKPDPLEGELTEMGAGMVLRRKADNLGELFIFRNKKKLKNNPDAP